MNGLKTKISLTLLISLFFSMVCISIICILFWQQHVLSLTLDTLANQVNVTLAEQNGLRPETAAKELFPHLKATTPSLTAISLVKKEHFNADPSLKEAEVPIRRAFHTNTRQTGTYGTSFSSLGFNHCRAIHALPVSDNGAPAQYCLVLDLDLEQLYQPIREKQQIIFFYILINVSVFGTIFFFRLVRDVIKPIDRLISISENYTGTGGLFISEKKISGEFNQLNLALNTMVKKITNDKIKLEDNVRSLKSINDQLVESQRHLVRAEKIAAVGRLSAGMAHEIGNPIGIVQGYLDLLSDDNVTADERCVFTEKATKELDRVNRMIRQLLDFSRISRQRDSTCSANQVCRDALRIMELQNKKLCVQVSCSIHAENDTVLISSDYLHQVIVNCILNAIDAIQDQGIGFDGKISVETKNIRKESDHEIVITISDNGCGIDEKTRLSVFDPFFTTKDVGKGTGLGLFVSYSIIESASGTMEITSRKGYGTSIVITLPVYEESHG